MRPEVEVRLKRTLELYTQLGMAAGAAMQSDPPEFDVSFDNDNSEVVVSLSKGSDLPAVLGVHFGEVIQGLRNVLDNAVWYAIVENTGSPLKMSAFPIHTVEKPNTAKTISARTAGLTAQQRAVVDGAQPYNWADRVASHPLAVLHECSNIDKHHMLIGSATMSMATFFKNGRQREFMGPDFQPLERSGEVRVISPSQMHDCEPVSMRYGRATPDDPELARFKVNVTGPNPRIAMTSDAQVYAAWGTNPSVTMAGLAEMYEYVEHVVQQL